MNTKAEITDPRARPTGRADVLRAYVELTKPRIIELLLTTTVPAMILAGGGWPGTWLVVATLIGNQGNKMRCSFSLEDRSLGLPGGATGKCQVSNGDVIEVP